MEALCYTAEITQHCKINYIAIKIKKKKKEAEMSWPQNPIMSLVHDKTR